MKLETNTGLILEEFRSGFLGLPVMGLVFVVVVIGFVIGKIGWRDFTGF